MTKRAKKAEEEAVAMVAGRLLESLEDLTSPEKAQEVLRAVWIQTNTMMDGPLMKVFLKAMERSEG